MNSKTIFKRILPILVAILVVAIIAVVSTIATSGKKNPTLENGKDSYIVYTTANGTEIKVSNEKVWNTLKGSVTAATTTVSEFVDQIDRVLLQKEVSEAKVEDVTEAVEKYLFGSTFDEYLKANKKAWELAAKKKGGNWEALAIDAIKEVLDSKKDELKFSYGITADLTNGKDVTYLENGALIETNETDEDGEKVYGFTVKQESELYSYHIISVARTNYALAKLTEEYEEEVVKYNTYLKDLEKYEEYLKDLEDYEEAYEDWKNDKKNEKPVKPTKVEKPEEVEAPILVESDFEELYKELNQNEYWTILIPYASNQAAVDALYQQNIVVATNFDGDSVWFNAADLSLASATAKAAYKENNYSVRGDDENYTSGIITDNKFYQLLMTKAQFDAQNKQLPAYIVTDDAQGQNYDLASGAYQLSENEIKAAIIKLYNQFYQNNSEKQLVEGTDYTKAADGTITFNQTDAVKYTETELSELSLFHANSTSNKFNSFEKADEFIDYYTNKISSAGDYYYVYFIIAKTTTADWEDTVEAAEKDYTKTEFYAEKKAELLEGALTTAYTNEAVAELRYEKGLKIFDADLEAIYMSNYTSDYKAVKKTSKSVIASVEGLEVKLADLFNTLTEKYGILTALESYQYDWMFLEANYGSKEELANIYVDYAAYKAAGKNLSKYIYKNDEAKELYEEVQKYVTNTKNNFATGNYESQGYPADYGWENFMKDYFLESYGVEINSTDDLALFYIYQQIVDDYAKYLAKLEKEVYDEIITVYMAQQLATYINTTGVHLLIKVTDEEGEIVDPVNWTAAQTAAAEQLYKEVYSVMLAVKKDKVSSVLTEIVTAFDEAPLLLEGLKPNASYQIYAGKDVNDEDVYYTENILNYVYTYYAPGNKTYTVDLATPKSLGLSIITESLTITEGQMVQKFENAVRELWNGKLADLLKGESVNEKQVYNGMIETEFGYHLYVNLTMNYSNYQTTVDDETELVTFPSYEHALMYVYESNENAEDDYVSFADLLEDYEDAVEDEDDEKKSAAVEAIMAVFEKIGIEVEFETEGKAILEAYAGDDSAYTKKQLNTWFATYSSSDTSNSFTNVYGDFTSSSYYQLKVLGAILAAKGNFKTGDVEALDEYLTYYVDMYYDALQYLGGLLEYKNTGKMDKEDLEAILATIYTLTIGTDATEKILEVAPTLQKLIDTAKAAAADYTEADFEGNALEGFKIVTK